MTATTVNYKSVFDIIGPIMIGPSSSHTAGAVAIGKAAREVFRDDPTKIVIHYFESFAETHLGHGTDYAIISGILGFAPDDARVPDAVDIAKERGISVTFIEEDTDSPIHHPNTAIVELSNDKHAIELSGCSIGGGTIEVRNIKMEGYEISPTGTLPVILAIFKTPEDQDKFNKDLEEMSLINKSQKYLGSERKDMLLEYELDTRLKADQIKALSALTDEMIYI
jgi:L-serine dehydratase